MKAPDDGVQFGDLHLRRLAVGRMPPDGRWLDKTLGLETQVSTMIVSAAFRTSPPDSPLGTAGVMALGILRVYTGTSSALTTKPARSLERIGCLPRVCAAHDSALSMDASDVCREPPTSSTRGIAGTGLKKWVPMTWSGRPVAPASFMMRIEDVGRQDRLRVLDHLVEGSEEVALGALDVPQ
jgi:hypothetical protein